MGLTIHYTFQSNVTTYEEAKAQVEALRDAARHAGFKEVRRVRHWKGQRCSHTRTNCDCWEHWLLLQAEAAVYVEHPSRCAIFSVRPQEIVGFSTHPGDGCEPANFGLCRYPARVFTRHCPGLPPWLPTQLGEGWHWHSFCKTQYANDSRFGGLEHFLRCHTGICKVLDRAAELGILREVDDEGEYWPERDLEKLAKSIASWDEFVAACVGRLKDALTAKNPNERFEAPILQRPDFEHLEARGVAKLAGTNRGT